MYVRMCTYEYMGAFAMPHQQYEQNLLYPFLPQAIARYQQQGVFDLQLLRRMQAHDPETLKLLFRKGEA
jgi:hypothetical protein